jgi:uncharacterized damage-inducible protein DinB
MLRDGTRALTSLRSPELSTSHLKARYKARTFRKQEPFVAEARTEILITPAFVRTMAAYNGEMNRRLYAAAGRLTDAARREMRGAFWGSIHGTLCHTLWGDQMWMSRFDNWPKPQAHQRESACLVDDFDQLKATRFDADARITDWAQRVSPDWLAGEMVWYSMSVSRELRQPTGLLVTHLFNHQAHHRGQAHAMITAAGEKTGDTDLPFVI